MVGRMMPNSFEAPLMSSKQFGMFVVYKVTGKARGGYRYAAECTGWRLESKVIRRKIIQKKTAGR